jgi:hypothetical protein
LPVWAAEVLLGIVGLGIGMLFPLSTVAVQNAVERRDLGVATATHAFLRSLGTVVVIAALGAIFLSSGLGAAIEGGGHVRIDAAHVALAGDTFRAIFGAAALGQLAGFVVFLFLEERPLGGRAAPPPGEG